MEAIKQAAKRQQARQLHPSGFKGLCFSLLKGAFDVRSLKRAVGIGCAVAMRFGFRKTCIRGVSVVWVKGGSL